MSHVVGHVNNRCLEAFPDPQSPLSAYSRRAVRVDLGPTMSASGVAQRRFGNLEMKNLKSLSPSADFEMLRFPVSRLSRSVHCIWPRIEAPIQVTRSCSTPSTCC